MGSSFFVVELLKADRRRVPMTSEDGALLTIVKLETRCVVQQKATKEKTETKRLLLPDRRKITMEARGRQTFLTTEFFLPEKTA